MLPNLRSGDDCAPYPPHRACRAGRDTHPTPLADAILYTVMLASHALRGSRMRVSGKRNSRLSCVCSAVLSLGVWGITCAQAPPGAPPGSAPYPRPESQRDSGLPARRPENPRPRPPRLPAIPRRLEQVPHRTRRRGDRLAACPAGAGAGWCCGVGDLQRGRWLSERRRSRGPRSIRQKRRRYRQHS